MSLEQVAFEDVFDGSDDFAPIAILQSALPDLARSRHYRVSEGSDGLDEYSAVPLALDRGTDGEVRFALWRHRGNPQDTFAIHVPVAMTTVPGLVTRVVAALGLEQAPTLWLAPGQSTKRDQTVAPASTVLAPG